jgi:hypothetical protein
LQSFDPPWLTLLISESTKYEDEMQKHMMEKDHDHEVTFTPSLGSFVDGTQINHQKFL